MTYGLKPALFLPNSTYRGLGGTRKYLRLKEYSNEGLCISNRVNIDLSNSNIMDINVIELAPGCPKLPVRLQTSQSVTDASLKEGAQRCPEVSTIDLSSVGQITDNGLSALTHGCRKLHTLKLLDNQGFSDISISIFASCHRLMNTTKHESEAAQCAKSSPSSDGRNEEYDFQDYEGGICLDNEDETQRIVDETNEYYGLL